jgi:hypothetical protein
MDEYRVPQRKVPVRVRLEDGRDIEGFLFAPDTGPDGEPGRVVDRLNDEPERFLALVGERRSCLLHKGSVVAIELSPADGNLELHEGEHATEVRVELRLETNLVVSGTICYTMPPERQRVLDFLNAAPDFISVETESSTTLLNVDRVISVVDRGGAEAS